MSRWNSGGFNSFGGNNYVSPDELASGSPAMVSFLNAVYGWMAAGLGMTTLVAWIVAHNLVAFRPFLGGVGIILLIVAELALVWTIAGAVQRISASVATVLFLLFSALNGVNLSFIFLVYTQATIFSAFLITGVMFGVMSLYGLITQRDLTRWGSLLFMCLVGLIVASVVNIFMASSGLQWLIDYAGVAIFVGLTAYDTQRLKYMGAQTAGDAALAARLAITGALALYLDFINLFLMILQLLANNSNRK